MRILHVLQSNRLSGAENVVGDICMMFKGEHEMAYCSRDGSIREAMADRDVPYIPIETLSPRGIQRVIKNFRPDIIHAHDVSATVITAIVSGQIPFISHLHVNAENMRTTNFKSILYMLAARKAKYIIVVSESCIEEYKFKNAINNITTCLRNIIYTPRIEKLVIKDTNDYSFDFVYLGRLSQQKNPARIARVASSVLKQCPTSKFGVIGEGTLQSEMEAVFKAEDVAHQVVFTGRLDYPYKALKKANCMLMCSLFEGTPISVLEAMALGVPIVSTPVDGMKEMVENGTTGFLTEDDKELAQKVVQILNNKRLRESLSKASIKKFSGLNNINIYKSVLEGIYELAGR